MPAGEGWNIVCVLISYATVIGFPISCAILGNTRQGSGNNGY